MSNDVNTRFCRILLQQIQRDLTANELADFKANSGTLRSSSGSSSNPRYLVEWPRMDADGSMFAWQGIADNPSDAKAQALHHWLESHAPAVRARKLIKGWESETFGR